MTLLMNSSTHQSGVADGDDDSDDDGLPAKSHPPYSQQIKDKVQKGCWGHHHLLSRKHGHQHCLASGFNLMINLTPDLYLLYKTFLLSLGSPRGLVLLILRKWKIESNPEELTLVF